MQRKSGLPPPDAIAGEKLVAVVQVEAALLQVSSALAPGLAAPRLFFPPEDGPDGSAPHDLSGYYSQLGVSSGGETTLLLGRRRKKEANRVRNQIV